MEGNPPFRHNKLTLICLLAVLSGISSQKCGRTIMDKIIHGQEVARGTYPWMVSLVRTDNPTSVQCGGALISRRFVVTAKHCTTGSPKKFKLLMGTNNLKFRDPSVKLYSIKEYIQHEGENDIALIRTKLPVKLDNYVQPICLPPGTRDYSSVQAVVVGYGETNADIDDTGISKYSETLLAGVVNTTSTENCNQVMARYEWPIGDDMLCAGSYNGQPDHCYGDSGGPLMYFDQNSGTWQLIGAVSSAYSCANPKDYSFYANVTYYRDWIISNSDLKN